MVLVIIAIIGAVGFLAWRHYSYSTAYDKLIQHYEEQSDAFHKQLYEIDKVNRDWREQDIKLQREYTQQLAEIRIEYTEKIDAIKVNRIVLQTTIINEAKTDPTTLTERIYKMFGIPTVKLEQK